MEQHHRHRIYKYLGSLLANLTARKASPPIIPKVAVARWRTAGVIISLTSYSEAIVGDSQ